MEVTKTKTAVMSALIAAILASAGGAHFLKKNPNPTLREAFKACEAGELHGIVCCENVLAVKDNSKFMQQCGEVSKATPDPFGIRVQEENDWDKKQAEQEKELHK